MANVFNQVQSIRPRTNRFDLSHDLKLTFNIGELVPTMCIEALPGDKFHLKSENLVRFAPMLAPIMHRIKVYNHFFFVPNRLLWTHWEEFITRSKQGKVIPDEDLPVAPYTTITSVNKGTIGDYMGLPTGSGFAETKVSMLPCAAYTLVYSEFYRDENLTANYNEPLEDGLQVNGYANPLFKRAWQHDYFTSCLPFAQKGEPVNISPAQSFGDVDVFLDPPIGGAQKWITTGEPYTAMPDGAAIFHQDTSGDSYLRSNDTESVNPAGNMDPDGTLWARTSDLEFDSITVNDLRRATKLQEWLEKNARGGSRYIETIESHFGVRSSDKRLNRPEFIGGSSQNVQISEVLQTSETDAGTPQGNMAGHAISVGSGGVKPYFCEEHGFIICMTSILPVTSYQQGIHRMFSRESALDFYWPSFAHLGEQEVLNKELYLSEDANYNEGTFGYIPRYSEYKFQNSRVAGDFRDDLDFWHMGRIFDTRPALNTTFINCDPDNRVFAVQDQDVDHVWCHIYNSVRADRRMPVFGTPKL